ncbi:MAG: hypothetical protein K0R10_2170 [Alphaproteobacteria bacterium]|jgi:uncharacterized phiE125 gp8 family phage protein|nr:hypothetical protein [Alphaproteobacteria bacterium]
MPPATEPVSLAEAKAHLRVTSDDEDTLISALIVAAREAAEHETGRSLITQTWEKTLDVFPADIRLDYPPVQSVTSIKFLDENGDEQTLSASSYKLDNASDSGPGWIKIATGLAWPSTYPEINAVRVRYVAGWTSAAEVPQSIKQWMLLNIGHWYENREATSEAKREPLPFIGGLLGRYWIPSI